MSADEPLGIAIDWDGEIEYVCDTDIDGLMQENASREIKTCSKISHYDKVIEYNVRAKIEKTKIGINLILNYEKENIEKLISIHKRKFFWGTCKLLNIEKNSGCCEWHLENGEIFKFEWKKPVINTSRKHFSALYRNPNFRKMILDLDGYRCVISEECTIAVLEAAHLIPVKDRRADFPNNGISLRADLHKLFDKELFHFSCDGSVEITDHEGILSNHYREYLDGKRLSKNTLDRVKSTLQYLKNSRAS